MLRLVRCSIIPVHLGAIRANVAHVAFLSSPRLLVRLIDLTANAENARYGKIKTGSPSCLRKRTFITAITMRIAGSDERNWQDVEKEEGYYGVDDGKADPDSENQWIISRDVKTAVHAMRAMAPSSVAPTILSASERRGLEPSS
jgi:hypothetical protein